MMILDPRTWTWSGGRNLIVEEGRVGCPIRGDVDMEECFACGRMLRFEAGRRPLVVCGHPLGDQMLSRVDRAAW